MHKPQVYPGGILRFCIKTDLPKFLTNFLRFFTSFLPMSIRLPLKIQLLLMPSHKDLIPIRNVNSDMKYPKVDVLIPFHPKDIALLIDCLRYILRNSINPIDTVRIVTTPSGVLLAKQNLAALERELASRDIRVDIIDEKVFLPSVILDTCNSLGEGSGWLIQQSIKIWNAIINEKNPTVVIDADTFIIQRILWIDCQNKSNVFANFHENDVSDYFIQKFPNILRSEKDFGYVSHFVLMKPHVVSEFLTKVEQSKKFQESSFKLKEKDIKVRYASVLSMLLRECMFNFSEYDFYAKFALKFEPKNTLICKWSNLTLDVNEEVDDETMKRFIQKIKPSYLSLSIHTFSLRFSGPTRTQEMIESRIESKGTIK